MLALGFYARNDDNNKNNNNDNGKRKKKGRRKKERNLLADISRKERSSVTLFCPLKNVLML